MSAVPVRLSARLLPALLFTGLVLALYADPLFFRRNFIGHDILPYNVPLEKAVHDSWTRGQIPVWSPSVSGGRPLLPNPNAGVFYPVRVALSLVPLPLAMRVFPIFHWVLAGWGMLLLLRAIGGSRSAAWVAAVSYPFSGVIVSEVFFGDFHPGASLLPGVSGRSRGRQRGRSRAILPIALVYGLMFLAGDVFSLALAFLAGSL